MQRGQREALRVSCLAEDGGEGICLPFTHCENQDEAGVWPVLPGGCVHAGFPKFPSPSTLTPFGSTKQFWRSHFD